MQNRTDSPRTRRRERTIAQEPVKTTDVEEVQEEDIFTVYEGKLNDLKKRTRNLGILLKTLDPSGPFAGELPKNGYFPILMEHVLDDFAEVANSIDSLTEA